MEKQQIFEKEKMELMKENESLQSLLGEVNENSNALR